MERGQLLRTQPAIASMFNRTQLLPDSQSAAATNKLDADQILVDGCDWEPELAEDYAADDGERPAHLC